MRKSVFLGLALCLLAVAAWAAVDTFEGQTATDTWEGETSISKREGQTVAGGGVDYSQDFEGTGAPTGFSTYNGTIDYDQSTTGIDMEGSECLALDDGALNIVERALNKSYDEVYITAKIRKDVDDTDIYYMLILDSSDNTLAQFRWRKNSSGDVFSVLATGGTLVAATDSLAKDTSQYIRVRYKRGTGANAEAGHSLWNGSAWTAETVSNDGTSEAPAAKVRYSNGNGFTLYVDTHKESGRDISDPE